jgi:type I restriction enzyme S subunit
MDLVLADASEDYAGVGKAIEITGANAHKTVAGLHTMLLRPKTDRIVQGFGGFIQFMPIYRDQIQTLASGLKVYGISKSNLSKIKIYLPPKGEQKAIAKALSEIDELIETLKSEIIKRKNLHTAVIQKLFPTNYLKIKLPNGWELRSLGELGTISGAGVDKVSRSSDFPIKLLNYMDVHRNTFVTPAIDFMDTTATKDQIRNCSLIKGDVLFTPTSETPDDIARSSVVLNDFRETCYSYHLIRFRPKIKFDLNYLAFVFLLEDFRLQAQKAAEGSGTRYVITLPRFRSLLIPIPDIKIQNEIGQAVNDISNQIESLKNELEKYQQLKSGMAHDLLTGKVRLV